MATTGTNYTAKWELVDGVLTISPVSGSSGEMRGAWSPALDNPYIKEVVDMTDEEWLSVTHIVFTGSVKIKMHELIGSNYYPNAASLFAQTSPYLSYGDFSLSNVVSIDVSGLDTTGCTGFENIFRYLTSLVEIIGLDTLDTSSVTTYSSMFLGTSLSELDLSSFSNMNTAEIITMFSEMDYLASVILPNNFSRTSPELNNEETIYKAIGMASSRVPATNQQTQVTIMSDKDFFALETGQGGTWIRHISGSATLSFKINSVQRDGNNATVSYSYATSTATAYVYLKESSASSFPQSPTETISLAGSGNGTLNLTLANDSSYEIQFIVTDGETNLYTFASIDSNVLLIEVDNNGNVRAAGDYYSKVNQISLGTYITGGVLTNGSSDIHFSIPTGRVFPDGTTISKLTFNIVVRAGNSNASGMYIVKSASGGTDVKYYDSTASFQFYNGANQSKTLTTAMSTIVLQGGTNIDVHWLGSGNYFFSGSSTNNGYVNNQPISIILTEITATLNIPS